MKSDSPIAQIMKLRPREGQGLFQNPSVHSPPPRSCGAGPYPSRHPLVPPPLLPGSGHPPPGPVGAAPDWGEGVGVTIKFWELPWHLPMLTEPPSLPRMGGARVSLHQGAEGWGGQGIRGFWEAAMGLPHLPSPMASVCTWTVKSCQELSWNTEVWTQSRKSPLPSQALSHSQGAPAGEGRNQGYGEPSRNHLTRLLCPLLRWES